MIITDVLMQPAPIEDLVGIDAIFVSYLQTEKQKILGHLHHGLKMMSPGMEAIPNTGNRVSGFMEVTPWR